MTAVLVLVAGAVGAVGRHLLVVAFASRPGLRFPLGLLVANVAGSLALGLLVGAGLEGTLSATTLTVLGTGFCGALTSWSSFVVDAAERLEAGDRRGVAVIVLASLVLGCGAGAAGLALTGGL